MICDHPIGARAVQPFRNRAVAETHQLEQCYDCGSMWVAPKQTLTMLPSTHPEDVPCDCQDFPYTHTLIDHIMTMPEIEDLAQ